MRTGVAHRVHRIGRMALLPLVAGLVVGGGSVKASGVDVASPGSTVVFAAPPPALVATAVSPLPEFSVRPASAVRPRTMMLGSWVRPRGSESHQQAVSGLEKQIGRKLAIDHVYHGWNGHLIGPYERWSAARGHTLLINWKAALETPDGRSEGDGAGYVRWADIAAGRYDADIVATAREIKRFKKLVYLSFHHEPEDDQDRPGWRRAGTPAEYRAAWRHVRAVFRRERVRNVRFVFILMGWSFRGGRASDWYPGGRFVDAIGADAYNWFGTAHPGATVWSSFHDEFLPAYRFARSAGKPFWVTETGVQEDGSHPGRKAAWYRSVLAQARSWPDLQAVVFFMGGRYGWYPDSSARSLGAFRSMARSALFRGSPQV